jgi:hypothetical protein
MDAVMNVYFKWFHWSLPITEDPLPGSSSLSLDDQLTDEQQRCHC